MFSQNLSSTAIAAEFLGYTMIEPWRMTDDDATDLVFTIQNISDRPHRFRASVRSVTPPAAEKGPKGGTITSCHPVGFGSAEVEPGATVHLLARPQVVFRGDALAIADAEHFEIVDLIVGNRSADGDGWRLPEVSSDRPDGACLPKDDRHCGRCSGHHARLEERQRPKEARARGAFGDGSLPLADDNEVDMEREKSRGFVVEVQVRAGHEDGDRAIVSEVDSLDFRSRRSRDRFLRALRKLYRRADLPLFPGRSTFETKDVTANDRVDDNASAVARG